MTRYFRRSLDLSVSLLLRPFRLSVSLARSHDHGIAHRVNIHPTIPTAQHDDDDTSSRSRSERPLRLTQRRGITLDFFRLQLRGLAELERLRGRTVTNMHDARCFMHGHRHKHACGIVAREIRGFCRRSAREINFTARSHLSRRTT